MNKILIFILCSLVIFSSCKKDASKKTNGNQTHGFDVYILGRCGISQHAGPIGGYWKNGVFKALTAIDTPSYARSMTISGKDVYVAGYYLYNGGGYYSTASAYWKNGKLYDMPDAAQVNCVAVIGNDLYIGGASYTGTGAAKVTYWKNGVKHVLDYAYLSSIVSISVHGNDVYMIGFLGGGYGYWINDKFISEVDVLRNSVYSTRGWYVNGNDVYFCGQLFDNTQYNAEYWKNGVFTKLGNNAQATAINVAGADLYCAGYTRDPSGGIDAYYWKNGAASKVDDHAVATDLAIDNTDLYIGGEIIHDGPSFTEAVYWLNGKRVMLPNPYYKPNDQYTYSEASQVLLMRY